MRQAIQKSRRFIYMWLFSGIRESVTENRYRVSGIGRAVVLIILSATTLLLLACGPETMGFRADLAQRAFTANLLVVGINIIVSLWIAYGHHNLARLRRLTYLAMITDVACIIYLAWLMGSVTSHVVAYAMVTVVTYRLFFDRRIGLTCLGALTGGYALLTLGEAYGLIEPQPLIHSMKDSIYLSGIKLIGASFTLTVCLIQIFAVVDWIAIKLRGGEIALNLVSAQWALAKEGNADPYLNLVLDGTYLIEAKLANGSMGAVYRGRHQRTQKQVAVKFLHPQLIGDEVILERFKREAEITAALGSRNIVNVYDVQTFQGQPYIVMEYLEGSTLKQHVRNNRQLSLEETVGIIEEVSWGLERAHAAGIVHRDLKPDNIYLARSTHGNPIGKNSGLWCIEGTQWDAATDLGYQSHWHPSVYVSEQTFRADKVDQQTDIFALAGIAYYCLTGGAPFGGKTIAEAIQDICYGQPEDLKNLRPDLPRAVSDVIQIGLAKAKSLRYTSAREFAHDLKLAMLGTAPESLRDRASQAEQSRIQCQGEKIIETIQSAMESYMTVISPASREPARPEAVEARQSEGFSILQASSTTPKEPYISTT